LLEFLKTALIKRLDNLEKQMRHKIRLIKPGTRESRSRYELNVPVGVFSSPQHAWAKIEMNGIVRIGPDDLVRKIFDRIDQVELPQEGQRIEKGGPLFSLKYADFTLAIPSPLSGKISYVNSEHTEHPEWLAIKPFELSWMCGIEPSNLAGELSGLKIGQDSVDWYQQEIDRFHKLASGFMNQTSADEPDARQELPAAQYIELLDDFTKAFRQAQGPV
jgi:glycine cleavage system H lipoate-binding protein